MSAVHLTSYGSAETAEFSIVPCPKPSAVQPGHVVVRMTLRPVDPADIFSIMGVYPGFNTPRSLPATPGLEGLGVVEMVGAGVSGFATGQRVVPIFITEALKAGRGSWADYVEMPAEWIVPVPEGVSDQAAAQLVVNPMTALAMVRELGLPGTRGWLINNAAGSVLGRQVIEMGRALGFRTINVVRRAALVEELRALGGDVVLVEGEDLAARVRAATGGALADAAIEPVGGDKTAWISNAVKDGGVVLVYGAMAGLDFKGSVVDCLFRDVKIHGFWITPRLYAAGAEKSRALAQDCMALLADGAVKPHSGRVFPLAEVAQAVKHQVQDARGGKGFLSS
eukprot:tig00001003_g6279.t1